jgi:hypothetical protein
LKKNVPIKGNLYEADNIIKLNVFPGSGTAMISAQDRFRQVNEKKKREKSPEGGISEMPVTNDR